MLFYIMELIRLSLYYYNIFFEIAKYLTKKNADRHNHHIRYLIGCCYI